MREKSDLNLFLSLVIVFFLNCSVLVNVVKGENFSFAVIADPHIDGSIKHEKQLKSAISWIIKNKDETGIKFVFVLGDIGWSKSNEKDNLKKAKEILDDLTEIGIEYIPFIGDNEIQAGEEKDFGVVFKSQFEYLSKKLDNFRLSITSVKKHFYYNYSFDYENCHFVCCDFVTRQRNKEGGDLNDFPRGSWHWFKDDIENCKKDKKENIVVLSHIGLFRTGLPFADQYLFDQEQMDKVENFVDDHADYIAANYAGHIHRNWHSNVGDLYDVWITDETWIDRRFLELIDSLGTVRWIEVTQKNDEIKYKQHIN